MKIFDEQGRRMPTPEEELMAAALVNRCGRVCEPGRMLALFYNAYQMLKEQLAECKENYDR